VATRDRDAGRGVDALAAFEGAGDRLDRQHVDRHARKCERHDRAAAYCIDVAEAEHAWMSAWPQARTEIIAEFTLPRRRGVE
jgi:hypothetical protein